MAIDLDDHLGLSVPFAELQGTDAEMAERFATLVEMGVEWVRTDIWWQWVQPEEDGEYYWGFIDRVFDVANDFGIEIIGELNGKTNWVPQDMSTTDSHEAFADFARNAAIHFGDQVQHWEIFNEPNMHGISPESYTEMLKSAYTAIKSVSPNDMVITGGLSATPETTGGLWGAVDYLEGIYDAGGKGYFDAVGFHPYTWPLMPEDSVPWNGWDIMQDGIRGTMVENGDAALDVWITELGAPTDGSSTAVSETVQADILRQAFELAGEIEWTGPLLWYSFQDRGGSTSDVENWFGLLRPDGTEKEAFFVFKELATKVVEDIGETEEIDDIPESDRESDDDKEEEPSGDSDEVPTSKDPGSESETDPKPEDGSDEDALEPSIGETDKSKENFLEKLLSIFAKIFGAGNKSHPSMAHDESQTEITDYSQVNQFDLLPIIEIESFFEDLRPQHEGTEIEEAEVELML